MKQSKVLGFKGSETEESLHQFEFSQFLCFRSAKRRREIEREKPNDFVVSLFLVDCYCRERKREEGKGDRQFLFEKQMEYEVELQNHPSNF